MASTTSASEESMSKKETRRTFGMAIGRWRLPKATTFLALFLLSLAPTTASADDDHHLRIMTQNLYVGSFFQELGAATTASDYVAAATITYQHILATRPADRAAVIADEIARLRPDFVGLEQAAILRTGIAPPATSVTFDLLKSLLHELAARGVRYETVALMPGLDAELPTALGFDVRLTLRDVLIVRADLLEEGHVKLSNLQIRQYSGC
jgi:hypothetical protein